MGAIVSNTYTSPEFRLDSLDPEFRRADIEFHGVDHSGPSFEARVFLNNPDATETTEMTEENGYAGSFHVYGYGRWPGSENASGQPQALDEPRAPMTRYVVATEA